MDPACVRCVNASTGALADASGKLLHASVCGHALCSRCLRDAYLRHRSIKCPAVGCGATLVQADFSAETPEERAFVLEKRVRKRLADVFNRARSDFAGGAPEYDAYCETRELLVAALVSGTPAERARAERDIADHRALHAHDIALAAARHAAEVVEEKRRAEDSERAANATANASASAEDASRRALESVRRFTRGVLLGDAPGGGGGGGGGGGDDAALRTLEGMRAHLLALRERKRAEAVAAARPPIVPPCPHIALPKFLSYIHPPPGGRGAAPPIAATLPRDQAFAAAGLRAGGVLQANAEALLARELAEQLLLY